MPLPIIFGVFATGILAYLLTSKEEAPKTRGVFFSFHYDDIMRVNQIKNHWISKPDNKAAGYFDKSVKEDAKSTSKIKIKKILDDGLKGSSVTCVLIGEETYSREWVKYEIFQSIAAGKGLFGININKMKCPHKRSAKMGINPFEKLAFKCSPNSNHLIPMHKKSGKWIQLNIPELEYIKSYTIPYDIDDGITPLSELFKTYSWVRDDGYGNFSSWVQNSATEAKR